MRIKKFYKLTIPFGFLLAGIVGYYFFLYVPQRNLALHPIVVENNHYDLNYSGKLNNSVFAQFAQSIATLEEADMDNDGKKELLVSVANKGGNHPPHQAYIIKDKKIVASVGILVGEVYASNDGNGFYLKEGNFDNDPLSSPKKYRLYRIAYQNGKYSPIWMTNGNY